MVSQQQRHRASGLHARRAFRRLAVTATSLPSLGRTPSDVGTGKARLLNIHE
jgi:hypothetical protein